MAGRPYDSRKANTPARKISYIDYAANFKDFLDDRPAGQPWCFWYGGWEPHRDYEYGAGIARGGKKLSDIDKVPPIWPDNEVVRTDMLDYAFEIEYFDKHLAKMLELLKKRGELDNTLVVVTADNGAPFPNAKGQAYESSNHMPLAIMWKKGIHKPGRVVDDYVSFVDFAPTYIELAGLSWQATGLHPTPGKSLTDIFYSAASGMVNPARDHVLVGKERHDPCRPNDWGYPIRGIFKDGMLYLRNFEPSRWPAGNPEAGYMTVDPCPTKTEILNAPRTGPDKRRFWELSFGKRPPEEFFNVVEDPWCINNLAERAEQQQLKATLKKQLFDELKAQDDPRMFGNGDIFETYPFIGKDRNFYERYVITKEIDDDYMRREHLNPDDVEEPPRE